MDRERQLIEDAFEHYDDANRLKVIARSSVSIDELFRLFNKYSGRILLFHFAGHANGKGLQFNEDFAFNQSANADGIAALLQREVTQGLLKFVCLNGCSTAPQVEGLKAIGVPCVIATQFPINDTKAVGFANTFYRTWAKSDNLAAAFDPPFTSIQTAFNTAVAYLKTSYTVEATKTDRGLRLAIQQIPSNIPWELYATKPQLTLDFEVAQERKTFNEFLTRRLIERLATHNERVNRFLQKANSLQTDWETYSKISSKAKELILSNFVGVLSIQLQNIFSIGLELQNLFAADQGDHLPTSQQKYLRACLQTTERSIQLVAFAFVSRLWDRMASNAIPLSDEERDQLKKFFDNYDLGLDIKGYWKLLESLYRIFQKHQLEIPFEHPSLKHFEQQFAADSPFNAAIEKLERVSRALKQPKFQLADCFTAEKQLVTVLETFIFLSAYKIISIREVGYDEMRNQAPRYIHTYTALGIDAKQNINAERIRSDDTPINTDAVLLYKGRYQESINLFPFIIDWNTLNFEGKAQIAFYDARDPDKDKDKNTDDDSLNYRFLLDHQEEEKKKINIVFDGILRREKQLEDIIVDREKFKTFKLDIVHQQFYKAREAILGEDDF